MRSTISMKNGMRLTSRTKTIKELGNLVDAWRIAGAEGKDERRDP